MSRPALSTLTVLADDNEVSMTITEALPLDFLDVRDTDGDFIALRPLSAANARNVADAVNKAVWAGMGTRITLGGRQTTITANGTSLSFAQDGRQRVVSNAFGHEIVRQLHSAANALDAAQSAGGQL